MKACFVGTGSIGKRHIRNLVAVCKTAQIDLTIDVLRSTSVPLDAVVAEYVFHELHSIDEVDTVYDAIFICNPTNKHGEMLRGLKEVGKSFFVEKPITISVSEGEKLLKELDDNKVYYVACPLRYSAALERARQIIAAYNIISVRAISSSYLPDWRPSVDYRTSYSAHEDQGGGVVIDIIHEWDYLIHLFGLPQQIQMMKGKFSNLEIQSDDLAVYCARYPDKLVELHLDYFGRNPRRLLELYSDETVWVIDFLNNKVYENGSQTEAWKEDPNDKYEQEMQFFVNLALGKSQINPNTAKKALQTLKVSQGLSD